MPINWGALGVVAVVSLIVGVLVVVLVSFALVGLSTREPDGTAGPADEAVVIGRGGSGRSRLTGTIVTAVCLLGAVAIVVYGLYLLVF